jgi:hypothetical protein
VVDCHSVQWCTAAREAAEEFNTDSLLLVDPSLRRGQGGGPAPASIPLPILPGGRVISKCTSDGKPQLFLPPHAMKIHPFGWLTSTPDDGQFADFSIGVSNSLMVLPGELAPGI